MYILHIAQSVSKGQQVQTIPRFQRLNDLHMKHLSKLFLFFGLQKLWIWAP